MSKRKTIKDPKIIFQIYSREYRQLWPTINVPQQMSHKIDKFVEDICKSKAIVPFSENELSTFSAAAGSVECSIYFIEYLRKISSEMINQSVFKLSPTRACELLYNLDGDRRYDPGIMRLKMINGTDALVSDSYTCAFKIHLWLIEPREDIDWTLIG